MSAHDRLEQERRAAEQWSRNKYSLYVDIGIAILFFALAKLTDDLPFSALVTAGAGLSVVVVQRFVKVDLLAGLALFGVFMLLVSAAFSYAFDSDWAVKMKSTLLGGVVAMLMYADAFLNRGHYFGGRLARFMPAPIVPQRMAVGMATLGVVMAAVNYAVASWFSTDVWLYYTSFGDLIVTMVLVFAVIKYATVREGEAGGVS